MPPVRINLNFGSQQRRTESGSSSSGQEMLPAGAVSGSKRSSFRSTQRSHAMVVHGTQQENVMNVPTGLTVEAD